MQGIIKIAIVDDEEIFTEILTDRVRTLLQNLDIRFEMQVFTEGETLLKLCSTAHFDLVFLDIDMPQVTGIDIARKLRMKQESTEIIFVTNKDDMVYDTIQYTPFRFIRKSRFELEVEEALEAYLTKKCHQQATYFFSTENGKKPVNIVKIVYIEVKSHKLAVHQQDTVFSANGNLCDIEKEISQYGFIRIHKSYLVNFRYINLIHQKAVILDDGNTLPLSRGKLETAKMELMRFSRGYRDDMDMD